jgi:MoaA/NifB/PqqE/SkfB family radical SAM enzyme
MALALTGECNLRCRYCYQNAKSGSRMPWVVLKSASDRLLESPHPHREMVFAGGEPLLELAHIRRVVDYVDRRRASNGRVRYTLATNGTLLSSEVIAFLDHHRFDVDVSFDGVPLAQSLRGTHSFASVDGALRRLCVEAPETFWGRLTIGVTLARKPFPVCLSRSRTSLSDTCRRLCYRPSTVSLSRGHPRSWTSWNAS